MGKILGFCDRTFSDKTGNGKTIGTEDLGDGVFIGCDEVKTRCGFRLREAETVGAIIKICAVNMFEEPRRLRGGVSGAATGDGKNKH